MSSSRSAVEVDKTRSLADFLNELAVFITTSKNIQYNYDGLIRCYNTETARELDEKFDNAGLKNITKFNFEENSTLIILSSAHSKILDPYLEKTKPSNTNNDISNPINTIVEPSHSSSSSSNTDDALLKLLQSFKLLQPSLTSSSRVERGRRYFSSIFNNANKADVEPSHSSSSNTNTDDTLFKESTSTLFSSSDDRGEHYRSSFSNSAYNADDENDLCKAKIQSILENASKEEHGNQYQFIFAKDNLDLVKDLQLHLQSLNIENSDEPGYQRKLRVLDDGRFSIFITKDEHEMIFSYDSQRFSL